MSSFKNCKNLFKTGSKPVLNSLTPCFKTIFKIWLLVDQPFWQHCFNLNIKTMQMCFIELICWRFWLICGRLTRLDVYHFKWEKWFVIAIPRTMLIWNNILRTKTLVIWGIQISAQSYSNPRTRVACFSKHFKRQPQ